MPPTLAEIADGLEARARQLQAEGKHEAATELALAAVDVRKALAGLKSLPKSTVTDKLRGDMEAAHRQKLSESLTAQAGRKTHPMMVIARKHGMASLQDLATALDYSKSMLSRILSGDREMPEDKARKFEELTGKPWRS